MAKLKIVGIIISVLLLLGAGVAAGVLIGVPIGEQRAYKEFEEQQEKEREEEKEKPTKMPEATDAPEISEMPKDDVTPTVAPEGDVTVAPTETPIAGTTPTTVPEATLAPGQTEATETPTEGITPTEGAVTLVPTVTGAAALTVTPKPSVTVKPTAKPTAKPTDIPVATGGNGYHGRLHVEKTYLADKDDNLVQLRGISTHGIGWFPQYVNEAAIRQFNEEWGCNVFRLAMYTAEGAGYCTNDSAHKEKLKNLIYTGVDAAIKQDMYVIVDWHVLQDQNPNTYKDEAKKFFAEVSEKYGDDPHVIYEICNEPNGGVTWSEIKKYALEVIPVIRENAPNAIIIVGTPTWSQDVDIAAKDPITEYENIMYALHFYASTHKDSLRNKCKTAVAKGLPLFVTEYGVSEASGDGYIDKQQAKIWMDLLDGYGISHVAWNLSNKSESSSMIAAGCSKVNGFTENDLSTGGKWFVDMLKEAGVGIGSKLSGTTEAGQGDGTGSGGSSGGQSSGGSGVSDYAEYLEDILTVGDGLTMSISNSWSSGSEIGVQLSLTVKNDSAQAVADWERTITVKEGATVEVAQNWNSTVTVKGNVITVKPAGYNANIAAGGSVGDIGLILNISE
ncbi:MAG: cellulase family glycosylhydrolase [Lachnospiraceae bacterium]|nr:cellulase family glycosylhydrolase [Lachnospiraceae bacterium]